MSKNRINYKLVNAALIVLIVFLLYKTGHLWMGITDKILQIIMPFLFAFAFAYALHPFLKKMQEKKIPKGLGVVIIIVLILALATLTIYLITTVMLSQVSSLFSSITSFISSLQETNFDFNFAGLETSLSASFDSILANLGTYVSNGAINIIGSSLGILSQVFIIFASFIYFLI